MVVFIDPLFRNRMAQMRSLLDANNVPRPHILWIHGGALTLFLNSIGRIPFPKDGPIYHSQLYRFNMDTGRYRKADPLPREGV